MMKILLVTLLGAFFLSSCAHHHKEMEHYHHKSCSKNCKMHHEKGEMFDKHCAMSVSEGDIHINGVDDYKLKHGGEIYYFSSEEKLNKFKNNLDKNVKKAQKNWSMGSRNR